MKNTPRLFYRIFSLHNGDMGHLPREADKRREKKHFPSATIISSSQFLYFPESFSPLAGSSRFLVAFIFFQRLFSFSSEAVKFLNGIFTSKHNDFLWILRALKQYLFLLSSKRNHYLHLLDSLRGNAAVIL